MNKLRILYAYTWYISEEYGNVRDVNEKYLEKLRSHGYDVEGFCLTLNPPGPCLKFDELDDLWKKSDLTLMRMYSRLLEKLEGKDVLINASGPNLHPEFVRQLPTFNVFQCFDDPESSELLSKPVAGYYDLCFVGNIAEVDTYRSWGVRNVEWMPLGAQTGFYDRTLTYEDILTRERDIDLFMMIDKTSKFRIERLSKLEQAFPDAHFYGRGWKRGILPGYLQLSYLARAKIGVNVHNSTGPINHRTFALPANGVMQICDNKSYLANIFEPGVEAIGFDSIDECIDLCRYYLAHDDERRLIAANGWKRAITEYTEESVFERAYHLIAKYIGQIEDKSQSNIRSIVWRKKLIGRANDTAKSIEIFDKLGRRVLGKIRRTVFPGAHH